YAASGGAGRGRRDEEIARRREAELPRVADVAEPMHAEPGGQRQERNAIDPRAPVDHRHALVGELNRAGQIAEPRRRAIGVDDDVERRVANRIARVGPTRIPHVRGFVRARGESKGYEDERRKASDHIGSVTRYVAPTSPRDTASW